VKTGRQPLAAFSLQFCENPENVRSNGKKRLEYKRELCMNSSSSKSLGNSEAFGGKQLRTNK
jgi:hypothetical protein